MTTHNTLKLSGMHPCTQLADLLHGKYVDKCHDYQISPLLVLQVLVLYLVIIVNLVN